MKDFISFIGVLCCLLLLESGSDFSLANLFFQYEKIFWFDFLSFTHFQSIVCCNYDENPFKNHFIEVILLR